MAEVTELTLDCSKWICGAPIEVQSEVPKEERYYLGEGPTYMLNSNNYMCCLGQFCSQLGVDSNMLRDTGDPADTYRRLEPKDIASDSNPFLDISYAIRNSDLSFDLMGINDSSLLTVGEKIINIKQRLAEEGIKLEVINIPDWVYKQMA